MTDTNRPKKGRVLSGMRPTGKLHLGNYVGALRNWVGLQDQYDCFFFIADWHALTTDYADTRSVKQNSLEVMIDYLAAGLDPERSTLFIQSHVLQHAELHLLFSMITPLGWLERVPSYKEQRENLKDKDLGTYGFLGYPLLQSADILIYQADFVPVGEDQVPHVELTREVARRFNLLYPLRNPKKVPASSSPLRREGGPLKINTRDVFPEPKPLRTNSPKLPGIDGRKMSKSYGNFISLTDTDQSIYEKLAKMVNDPQRAVRSNPGNPDVCPVWGLHKVFSDSETLGTVDQGCRTAAIGCVECKRWAADAIIREITPIRERRAYYESRPHEVWEILRKGSRTARKAAEATMREVRRAMQLPVAPPRAKASHSAAAIDAIESKQRFWTKSDSELQSHLRNRWLERLVPDIQLTEMEPQLYKTAGNKRVAIAAAREQRENDVTFWRFSPPKTKVDVMVFLCWRSEENEVKDFVVPQRILQLAWGNLKGAHPDVKFFRVFLTNGIYKLSVPGWPSPPTINELEGNYSPLQF
jgi:tryptophanyl-tRNA synthetase